MMNKTFPFYSISKDDRLSGSSDITLEAAQESSKRLVTGTATGPGLTVIPAGVLTGCSEYFC